MKHTKFLISFDFDMELHEGQKVNEIEIGCGGNNLTYEQFKAYYEEYKLKTESICFFEESLEQETCHIHLPQNDRIAKTDFSGLKRLLKINEAMGIDECDQIKIKLSDIFSEYDINRMGEMFNECFSSYCESLEDINDFDFAIELSHKISTYMLEYTDFQRKLEYELYDEIAFFIIAYHRDIYIKRLVVGSIYDYINLFPRYLAAFLALDKVAPYCTEENILEYYASL